MNNEIKNAFETMNPTGAQKARMLSGIKSRLEEESGRPAARRGAKWLRIAAVAAALCCLFSMTAFADEISRFIAGVFAGDAVVGEEVKTNVFYDTDGHVEVFVEEVVSDLSNVRIVLCYNALDKEGEEWLASLSRQGSDPVWYNDDSDYRLRIWPVVKWYESGGASGVNELEEYRTDTRRRFVLFLELFHDYWGTKARICYSVTGNVPRTTDIDVSTNIEKRVYELDSPTETERFYRPTFVKLSPLSVTVGGENLGLFYYRESHNGLHTEFGTLHPEASVESMRIIYRDGTETVMFTGGCACQNMSMYGPLLNTDDPDDCIIVSMSFAEPIDPDTVAGMEIDGIYYPFD